MIYAFFRIRYALLMSASIIQLKYLIDLHIVITI
jgi:hypothetical protein